MRGGFRSLTWMDREREEEGMAEEGGEDWIVVAAAGGGDGLFAANKAIWSARAGAASSLR